jgi:hypothetical protein
MSSLRRVLTPLGLALLVAAGPLTLFARDEPAKADAGKPSAPAARPKADPSRRVPNHFGQVGLTIEQRESIYKIRKAHAEKIEALRAEIAGVEAKAMAECEAVLTDTQKKLLENLRNAGARPAARAVETAKAAK